jgi:predicted RNA-binding protein with PUA domain
MLNTSFPLFNNLYNECSNDLLLTYDDQIELCNKIKDIDDEGCEIIFALIKFYYISIDNGYIDNLPYKPKINKNGYKYELNNLPLKLINMIHKFLELHINKIELDKNRNISN